MNETKVIFYCPLTTIIMAVDPLDNSSDRFLTVTMNEIKILVGMMTKLKELFPIEGHYYVHKACNLLITICKQQLATEDIDELKERYGI